MEFFFTQKGTSLQVLSWQFHNFLEQLFYRTPLTDRIGLFSAKKLQSKYVWPGSKYGSVYMYHKQCAKIEVGFTKIYLHIVNKLVR